MKNTLITVLWIFFLSSCQKEVTPQYESSSSVASEGIIIINEGNFQWGNGSMGIYNKENKIYQSRVFQNKNSLPLGDVPQSINNWNGKFYCPINSSGTIKIIDQSSFNYIGEIKNAGSPRYIERINDSLALITQLYNNQILIANYQSMQVIDSIAIRNRTEQMISFLDQILITAPTSNQLYSFSKSTLSITDSLTLEYGISDIEIDTNNRIWCLATSMYQHSVEEKLFRINPYTLELEQSIALDSIYSYGSLAIMDTTPLFRKNQTLVSYEDSIIEWKTFQNIYEIVVDPFTQEIFVADASDFIANSKIQRLSSKGELIDSFEAGVNTTYFYFEKTLER